MTERDGQVVTFYSYKGGTGRTMALANVAWILAANGKRVLVADWDLESPGLHRFFNPFIRDDALRGTAGVIDMIREYENETARDRDRPERWFERYARANRYAFSIRWPFPGDGGLDLLTAGRQNRDYAVTVGSLNWDNFWDRLGGAQFFDALRADMKNTYDYTLIDSRTGLSDLGDICTVHLPDVLVDCFTLSEQGIDGAARVARTVSAHSGQNEKQRLIRILPVPMRVDQSEKEKAETSRAVARRRFADLPSGMTEEDRDRYWAQVEVPYRPFYAYEETLAVFGDPPGSPTSLLSAYEMLTGYVTGGRVTALPPMVEAERLQVRGRFARRAAEYADDQVVLRAAPEDQVWADWIERLLVANGLRVLTPGPGEPGEHGYPPRTRTLTVASAAYLGAGTEEMPPRDLPGAAPPLAVYVSEVQSLPEFPADRSVSVAGLSERTAAERILGLFGRYAHRDLSSVGVGSRYPGTEPEVFAVPARNARFTGRDDELRQLRGLLEARGTAVVLQQRTPAAALPVALHGMGGIGKTQVALEYAYRFKNAYDVVWWVQSDPPQFIDTNLTDLAARIRVPFDPAAGDAVRAVREALRRGEPYSRWLMVFDNADDLDRVGPFLPEGNGHVILTSRNPAWGDRAHALPVDVFRRDESVAHLRQRVGIITAAEADAIAEALGDLPIAIAAAGAWLAETGTPVAEYMREIEQHGASTLAVEATWDLSLKRLREQSAAAYRLLQMCCVLGPEIALKLLNSDEMADALIPFDSTVSDRMMRGALIQMINRLALIKVDSLAGQVQVHRLLQKVVQDRMSEAELTATRHQVHMVLAGFRPEGEVDDPETWPLLRLIWPHLEVSDTVNCSNEAVRQLLIDRVRYLYKRGDLDQGERIGQQLMATWEAMLDSGADPRILRRHLLYLRFNIANILRDQGRFAEARVIDEEVLEAQRELLGERHSHTLLTAGSLAADLRGLGRFTEALARDERTYRTWAEVFGEDHSRSLAAANNLAVSHRAVGNFRAALSRDEKVFERRRAVSGPDHPLTLMSGAAVGRDLREAGEYAKSVDLLTRILAEFRRTLGRDSVEALTCQANLAVSLRSRGSAAEAALLLNEAYDKLAERFGDASPLTRSCRLSRASNLLLIGSVAEAVVELRTVTKAFEGSVGHLHPHTLVCVNNLSAALRAAGDREPALALAHRAATDFETELDRDHPYALAAEMNLATCVAESGDLRAAREQVRPVAERMAGALGPEHPDTLTCLVHLWLMRRRLDGAGPGAVSEPNDHLHLLEEAVGEGHPAVVALRRGELVYRILDPHPY